MEQDSSLKTCEFCWKNGESKKGVSVCQECREVLCSVCVERHIESEESKNHSLLDISQEQLVDHESKNSRTSADVLYSTKSVKNLLEDNDCRITSISSFPNDFLLVMDYGNNILKIYDEELEACIRTEVPPKTVGVACVSDEVIATLTDKFVYFWIMDGLDIQPMTTDKVKLKHIGHAIHSNEEVIGVLQTLDNYVQLFNKIGMELAAIDLKKIREKEIVTGYSICVNGKDQRVYVSDRDYDVGTSLLCIGFDRKIQWECPVPASVGGIVEHGDSIFVISIGSGSIRRLSKAGSFLSVFQSHVGDLPFQMCLQPELTRIVVCFNNTGVDRNDVKIYSLPDT